MIEDAFSGVRLGNGVGLHESVVIDNHGTDAQRTKARSEDEQIDWRKLVDDLGLCRFSYRGGLSFFDAEGLRFHLPAYLTLAIRRFESDDAENVLEILMYELTVNSQCDRERFSILTNQQKMCVRNVLIYLRHCYDLESEELDHAIAVSWAVDANAG